MKNKILGVILSAAACLTAGGTIAGGIMQRPEKTILELLPGQVGDLYGELGDAFYNELGDALTNGLDSDLYSEWDNYINNNSEDIEDAIDELQQGILDGLSGMDW